MSEYTVVKTPITDADLLRKALQDAGVPFEEAQGNTLIAQGYRNRDQKTVQFVVRKQHLGNIADLGYAWDPQLRCYVEIVDNYTAQTRQISQQVKQRAAYHQVVKTACQRGLAVVSQTTTNGHIQITLRG